MEDLQGGGQGHFIEYEGYQRVCLMRVVLNVPYHHHCAVSSDATRKPFLNPEPDPHFVTKGVVR